MSWWFPLSITPRRSSIDPIWQTILTPTAPGCICPPTSEKTCQSPTCPRKPHPEAGASTIKVTPK